MTNTEAPKITPEQAEAVLKVQGIPIHNVKYVTLTDLVPESWGDWFWDMFGYDAPFSFGDNNFTMITGDRLAEHLEECIEFWTQEEDAIVPPKEDWDQFIGSIWLCSDADIFIDLET